MLALAGLLLDVFDYLGDVVLVLSELRSIFDGPCLLTLSRLGRSFLRFGSFDLSDRGRLEYGPDRRGPSKVVGLSDST